MTQEVRRIKMPYTKEQYRNIHGAALDLYEACKMLIATCNDLAKTQPGDELAVPLAFAICGIKDALDKAEDN